MFLLTNFDENQRLFSSDSSRELETWTKNAFLWLMLLTCSLSCYFFHTIAMKFHISSMKSLWVVIEIEYDLFIEKVVPEKAHKQNILEL